MSDFMECEITRRVTWYECQGGELIPERVEDSEEYGEGIGYHLSAPGYLDCTPWRVVDTYSEAVDCAWCEFGPLHENEIVDIADTILEPTEFRVEASRIDLETPVIEGSDVYAVIRAFDDRESGQLETICKDKRAAYVRALQIAEKTPVQYGGLDDS